MPDGNESDRLSLAPSVLDPGGMKQCPKCLETKPIDTGFGIRRYRNKVYIQSHCRVCRAAAAAAR